MSAQNGSDDQATAAQAIAALLLGGAVRIRFRDETERVRLRSGFRRYASRLGFEAQIGTEEQVLIGRWTKAAPARTP